MPHDKKEANWLAWTCVDPEFRGKKIGAKLIDMMIEKSKKAGKKYLRLYTTDLEDQKVARVAYEKRGFLETKRERDKEHNCYTIYLELDLKRV